MTIFKHIAIATEDAYADPVDYVISFKIPYAIYAMLDFEFNTLTQHNELPKLVENLDSLTEINKENLTELINALTNSSYSDDDQIKILHVFM